MSTISRLIRNLGTIDFEKIIQERMSETPKELLSAQREQLMEGKDSTGQDITPSYLEDPFFKTREAAQRYSNWKDKITPNPKRKKGTPNLFINGRFHNSIDVSISKTSVKFDASFKRSQIIGKFGEEVLGLNEDKAGEYAQEHLAPEATKRIKSQILK